MNIWFAVLGISSFFASLVVSYLDYRLRMKEIVARENRYREQTQFELQQSLLGAMSPEARDEWLAAMARASLETMQSEQQGNLE